MMRAHRRFAIAACLFFITSQFAHAANIQVFTNRTSWEAATSSSFFSTTTEDFTDSTLDGGLSITAGSVGNGVFSGAAAPLAFPGPGAFKFQHGVLAFGGDWDLTPGGSGGGVMLTATFDDNTTQLIGSMLNPSSATQFNGFFGFVSDKPVITITYQNPNVTGQTELFNLDNASFRGDWWWWWGPGGIWFAFIIILPVALFFVAKKKRPWKKGEPR
jgi:hypothetical protein